MLRPYLYLLRSMAVGGLLCAMALPAAAQTSESAGIVRITDISPGGVPPIPEGAPIPSGEYPGPPGAYGQPGCPTCPGGNAYHGGNYGFAYDPSYGGGYGCPGGCPGGNCQWGRPVVQFIDWFNPCGMCVHSPGTGWAPPGKRPIYKSPVVYRKAFPNSWTGAPTGPQVRVPTVYMPTDTTQLGYYYQHVPYWLPRAEAIPPVPIPEQHHVSVCELGLPGKHPAGIVLGTAPEVIGAPLYDGDGLPYGPEDVTSAQAQPTPARMATQPRAIPRR